MQIRLDQQQLQLQEQETQLHRVGRGSVPPPIAAEASAPPLPPQQDRAQKKGL
jgi:hypothetical protein